MVVKHKYWFYLQRYDIISKIQDELGERQSIGALGYLIVEAVIDALAYGSEDGERAWSIFSLGKWHHKLLAVVVPGFLLDHISSERGLIKVNDWLFAHDPLCEFYSKFNSACLQKLQVVPVGKILLSGAPKLYIISPVESL